MNNEQKSDNRSTWREAAEEALLRGKIDDAIHYTDRAISAGGKTIDLLIKAELLCVAGELEKSMTLLSENMQRFEADLSPRELKRRLEPLLRKIAEYLLQTAETLYADARYVECAAFSQQVLTQRSIFLKAKKHRDLFGFAWKSSYDAMLAGLYDSGEYAASIEAVDMALTRFRKLTTLGQRSRYRQIRALSYFRLRNYGKALLNFLSVTSVQATIFVLLLGWFGLSSGLQSLLGSSIFTNANNATAQKSTTADSSSSSTASNLAEKPLPARQSIRRAEIKSLKLFEVSGEIPPVTARNYQTQFDRQSRRIFVEVYYRNFKYSIADVALPLVVRYYGPSGALLHEIVSSSSPKKIYESAITSLGWSPELQAGWPVGRYVVKVSLDGEPLQEVGFEIR